MNTRGVALAADSAVTISGEGELKKIYHTAEKLFRISRDIPVGIMTFDSGDMMGIPWETIVKGFAQRLGSRPFDTLEQYAANFFAFMEGSAALFPDPRQADYVKRVVWSVLSHYHDEVDKAVANLQDAREGDRRDALNEILEAELNEFKEDSLLETVGTDYGTKVLSVYNDEINEIMAERFRDLRLTSAIRANLREALREFYGRWCWEGNYRSSIVIAGMGEEEPFPTVLKYTVGTVAAGKLRYAKTHEGRVDLECDARVMPFAQRKTIDMILSGAHPDLKTALAENAGRQSGRKKGKNVRSDNAAALQNIVDSFSEQYAEPLMAAVSALPRQDLVKMAEALVSLTAFLMRMSAGEAETVAEPIDVALISKSDGFTWIKHKDLVRESGRLGA